MTHDFHKTKKNLGLFDRDKGIPIPVEIWVALTTERPEMINVYLNRMRATPDDVELEPLFHLIGAMAEECLDLRDRLRETEKLVREVRNMASGLYSLGDKLMLEADFLHAHPELHEPYEGKNQDSKNKRMREREEARPKLSDARQQLEAAFLAHVQGDSPKAVYAALRQPEGAPSEAPKVRHLPTMLQHALDHLVPEDETELRAELARVREVALKAGPDDEILTRDCWQDAQDALRMYADLKKGAWAIDLARYWGTENTWGD